ncbi:MAG: hypothetical protein D6820_02540 [Lentisphaerae bacterium]|nr:MAG: hypothetical protein D6820_02540 [Lentisphaerota bacterium]
MSTGITIFPAIRSRQKTIFPLALYFTPQPHGSWKDAEIEKKQSRSNQRYTRISPSRDKFAFLSPPQKGPQ